MAGIPLPDALLQSLQGLEGYDAAGFRHVHEAGGQVVSLRYNPLKVPTEEGAHFPHSERIPWSTNGFYLPSRPSFTLDPWLHAGAYYVQEASSMFLEQCLRQTVDLSGSVKVLDLCAAPGGKSTLIQSLVSSESLVVSNEVIKTRVSVLSENLIKWGGSNTVITNSDPRDFARLENYFDVMVVDAPCSGSGLFRRDPGAIIEWSPEAVIMCSQRQQRILADAYPALTHGGTLIYSTCSYSQEEDEDICDWITERFDVSPVSLSLQQDWNITPVLSKKHQVPGYRFFPDKLKGEGFFIACFTKNDGGEVSAGTKKNKFTRLSAKERLMVKPWINQANEYGFYHQNDSVLAFPSAREQDLIMLTGALYVKRAGVFIGKLAQGNLVPDHELALSNLVARSVGCIDLHKDQALEYLRKEEVKLESADRGWALMRYDGLNLGWAKLLGNRTNNYYPKEWRILKSGNS